MESRNNGGGVQLLMTNSRVKSGDSVAEGGRQDRWAAVQGTVARVWEGSSMWILESPGIRT